MNCQDAILEQLSETKFAPLRLPSKELEKLKAYLDNVFKSVKNIYLFGLRPPDGTLICNSEGKALHFHSRGDARFTRDQLEELFGVETFITHGPDHKGRAYSIYSARPVHQ